MSYSYYRTAAADPIQMAQSATQDALKHVGEALQAERDVKEHLRLGRIMSFALMGIREISDNQELLRAWNRANTAMKATDPSAMQAALRVVLEGLAGAQAEAEQRERWDAHYKMVRQRRDSPGWKL